MHNYYLIVTLHEKHQWVENFPCIFSSDRELEGCLPTSTVDAQCVIEPLPQYLKAYFVIPNFLNEETESEDFSNFYKVSVISISVLILCHPGDLENHLFFSVSQRLVGN